MDHACERIAPRRRISNASDEQIEFPGRWRSGQSQQTVNLPPLWLRRFEPSPPHQLFRAGAKVGRGEVGGDGPPLLYLSCRGAARRGGWRELKRASFVG
jgi:hypothetical protein